MSSENKKNLVSLYDIIVRPVITEKTHNNAQNNKYTFVVADNADKKKIKEAVEGIFGVKVKAVNVLNVKGKVRMFRGRPGKRKDYRKAIVTLNAGQSIDIASVA